MQSNSPVIFQKSKNADGRSTFIPKIDSPGPQAYNTEVSLKSPVPVFGEGTRVESKRFEDTDER